MTVGPLDIYFLARDLGVVHHNPEKVDETVPRKANLLEAQRG